jgi:hypothetical protein
MQRHECNKHNYLYINDSLNFLFHAKIRVLLVSMGHIYISHDVIFDESIFPFASLHSNAGARYHADILLTSPGNNEAANLTNGDTMSSFPIELPVQVLQCSCLLRMITPDQVPGSLPLDVVLSPILASSTLAAPNQPAVPDRAHDPVLPPTGPASPGLIGVNDPWLPPASSSAPQPNLSLALLPDMVPNQSMSPADSLPESSSAVELRSSVIPIVSAPAPPRTRLQYGIRKSKVYSDGTFRFAYSLTSGEPYSV